MARRSFLFRYNYSHIINRKDEKNFGISICSAGINIVQFRLTKLLFILKKELFTWKT
jgi:hypothetical protein